MIGSISIYHVNITEYLGHSVQKDACKVDMRPVVLQCCVEHGRHETLETCHAILDFCIHVNVARHLSATRVTAHNSEGYARHAFVNLKAVDLVYSFRNGQLTDDTRRRLTSSLLHRRLVMETGQQTVNSVPPPPAPPPSHAKYHLNVKYSESSRCALNRH
jgi:hypothetical protein